jgi:hypothetical protein
VAHRCSLVWMLSTLASASSRLGHGASVFTVVLLTFRPSLLGSLGPFAMYVAFPRSDYYGPSAPSPGHRQTACFAPSDLVDRKVGDPGAVPTFTTDRLAGSVPSFSPAGLATATPQSFTVAPDTGWLPVPGPISSVVEDHGALLSRPTSTRFEPV